MFERARNAVLLVLVWALALRVAWALVEPVVPALVALGVLAFTLSLLLRRDR